MLCFHRVVAWLFTFKGDCSQILHQRRPVPNHLVGTISGLVRERSARSTIELHQAAILDGLGLLCLCNRAAGVFDSGMVAIGDISAGTHSGQNVATGRVSKKKEFRSSRKCVMGGRKKGNGQAHAAGGVPASYLPSGGQTTAHACRRALPLSETLRDPDSISPSSIMDTDISNQPFRSTRTYEGSGRGLRLNQNLSDGMLRSTLGTKPMLL